MGFGGPVSGKAVALVLGLYALTAAFWIGVAWLLGALVGLW